MISVTGLKTQFKYQSFEYRNRGLLREIEKEILYTYNHQALKTVDITKYINRIEEIDKLCEMLTYFVELGYKCEGELNSSKMKYDYFHLLVE
jgi:hypothetical protein